MKNISSIGKIIGTIFHNARTKKLKAPLIKVVDKIKKQGGEITESYLARIEKGIAIPSGGTGTIICKALDLTKDECEEVRKQLTIYALEPIYGSNLNKDAINDLYK